MDLKLGQSIFHIYEVNGEYKIEEMRVGWGCNTEENVGIDPLIAVWKNGIMCSFRKQFFEKELNAGRIAFCFEDAHEILEQLNKK